MSSGEMVAAIWTTLAILLQEKGNQNLLQEKDPELLEELKNSGLIDGDENIQVFLTEKGENADAFGRSLKKALQCLLPEGGGVNADIRNKNNRFDGCPRHLPCLS